MSRRRSAISTSIDPVISRRVFVKGVGQAIGLCGLPSGAGAMWQGWQATKNDRLPHIHGVRIGVQTYSFRELPGDPIQQIIDAMTAIGLGECELYSPQAEIQTKSREELRRWRLTVPMDYFKTIRRKFDDAGIAIVAYNYSFAEDFTDPEIDRGFEMANALGAQFITASATIKSAARTAPFAEKHKTIVAMHGHSDTKDANQFATPESFAKALAMSRYFWVNLDIGHFFAAGFDPVAYIRQHHARITNIHLKDRKRNQGPNMPWGQGDTPLRQVLALLKEKKYPIPAYIEYEYNGAAGPVAETRKCFEFCKRVLA